MPLPIRQTLSVVLLAVATQATGLVAGTEADDKPWRAWHGILFRVTPPKAGGSPDALRSAETASPPTLAAAEPAGIVESPAQPAPDRPAASVNEPVDEPAAEPVSYLFGSIHYGSMDELDLDPSVIQDVLKSSQTLVDEADPQTRFDTSYDQYRYLSDGLTLKGLIGKRAFKELVTLLPAVKPEQLDRFKPWLVLALLESRGEIASENNLDGQIEQWSKDARLKQAHLETLREQMTALDCVPEREHALVVSQRLAEPWVLREQSERVLGYYRNRDLVGWLDEIDAVVGLDPRGRGIETRARQCLLEARNTKWIDRLDPMLRQGPCFVAVGAIHLIGETGLLNQLARRGYQIVAEPI